MQPTRRRHCHALQPLLAKLPNRPSKPSSAKHSERALLEGAFRTALATEYAFCTLLPSGKADTAVVC